jgi:hypothetical protein
LFAADFAVRSITINGLQNWIDQMVKYSHKWNLQCNVNKTTDTEKRKTEKQRMLVVFVDPRLVVVEAYLFIFLGAKLDSLGEGARQKESVKLKGKQSLRAADRCLMRVPSIKLKLLENMHAMICELRILYGVRKRDRMLLINFRRFCNSHKKPKEHNKRSSRMGTW